MFDIIKADFKSIVKVEDLPSALKKDDKHHKGINLKSVFNIILLNI